MEMPKQEPTWAELLGSNHWEGLLEPLNLHLRELIVRCGDFCQATYDSFNSDEHSKYCGSSYYGKSSLFKKVALISAENYFIDTFLYATAQIEVPKAFLCFSLAKEAWDRESNWIGYIAVTNDEVSKALGRREIYVAWRGTIRTLEWMNVFDAQSTTIEPLLNESDAHPTSIKPLLKPKSHVQKHWYDIFCGKKDEDESDDDDDNVMKVMKGWVSIYTSSNPNSQFTKVSARTQILTKIKELVTRYKDEDVSVVLSGHSLGASLAILSAFDLVENGLSKIPVTAVVFGSPQIGNKAFNDKLKTFSNLRVLHVKNGIDLIVHYPSKLLGYEYTGVELEVDTRKSTSLKDSKNPSDWHNLQAILHVVAGWNGKDGDFDLKLKRSVALVNKSCAYLKDEVLVPGSWWIMKNKGMVLNEDGEWVLASPAEEDKPVPEVLMCLFPGSRWIENKVMVLEEDGEWVLDSPAEEDIPEPEVL